MKYLKYSTVQLIDDVPERCKLRWVGEILRRASLLYDMMESYGQDDVEQSNCRGLKRLQMLSDTTNKDYENMKREAEDRTN